MKVGRYARCAFSTLVLPQHILTNPLHAPRRHSPLATLFAFDTRFINESVIAVSPCLPFHCIPPQTSMATQPDFARFPFPIPSSLNSFAVDHIAYRIAKYARRVAIA